jgi:hypothetical protein
MLDGKEFLRIAIFSGVLGFAVFCLSYSLLMWRKRNSVNSRRPTWTRRVAYLFAILGGAGLLATWGFSELESREGTAGGSDLFVVHARRDNAMMRLRPNDEVKAGEVVAEFIPPANQSQLAIKDFQQAQAQVRKEAIRAKPLSVDQGLVQREAQLRSQITKRKAFCLSCRDPDVRSRRTVPYFERNGRARRANSRRRLPRRRSSKGGGKPAGHHPSCHAAGVRRLQEADYYSASL